MTALAFYPVAAILVLAAAATVAVPSVRQAGYAALATSMLLAVLLAVSNAYALAVIQVVLTGITAALSRMVLRTGAYRDIPDAAPAGRSTWWTAATVAGGFGALFIVTFAVAGSGWHAGSGSAQLVTVFHYRAPYALVIAIALGVAGAGAGVLMGRRNADEQALDQHLEARRQREERTRRRREDRLKSRRPSGTPGEGEA